MSVRTRFAPSPTGYLHIGGLRTALYCYLLAKKENGQFLLRIEDTDQERLVTGSVENLIENLQWAGLNFDEGPEVGGDKGPYVQSERLSLYKERVFDLVKTDHAYHCFCTKDDLEQMRERQQQMSLPPKYDGRCKDLSSKEVEENIAKAMPFVIRQAIPAGRTIEFIDGVRGRVKFNSKDLEDQVLFKSDGFPTYHLANVIDDHLMGITHVIRGEEWLPSTPKHILLYEAFGWTPPEFVHLPLILNKDRSKLSKRQNDVSTESYRQKGYLKEAIINFIALLGWSTSGNQEIFSLDELVDAFSIDRVQKSGAIFDVDKLDWFNWQWQRRLYLDELKIIAKKLSAAVKINEYKPNHFNFDFESENLADQFSLARGEKLFERVKSYLSDDLLNNVERIKLNAALLTVEERLLKDPNLVMENISFYFNDKLDYQKDLFVKEKMGVDLELAKDVLVKSVEMLDNADFSSPQKLKNAWVDLIKEMGIKNGQMLWPCRIALTAKEFSPGVFDIAWVLGKDETIRRLNLAIAYIGNFI